MDEFSRNPSPRRPLSAGCGAPPPLSAGCGATPLSAEGEPGSESSVTLAGTWRFNRQQAAVVQSWRMFTQ